MPLATTRANASVLGLRGTQPPVQWVAVMGNGNLVTSNDRYPGVWTSRTSSFGTSNITSVASDGAGNWVAVGASGKIATSSDGITWTQRTSGFSTTNISWVAYGGGTWVATGASGKLSYSTDSGVTWTAVTTTTSGWSSSYEIGHVAYGNGTWVGINANGTIRTTTSPSGAWTSRTNQLGTGQHYAEYHPSFSIWTMGTEAGTSSGSLASSTDGTTWTARSAATSSTADSQFLVASNSSKIVSSGASAGTTPVWNMQTSTNGTSWSAVTEPSYFGDMLSGTGLSIRGQGEDILVGLTATFTIITPTTSTTLYWTTDGSTFTQAGTISVDNRTTNHIAHRLGHQSIR